MELTLNLDMLAPADWQVLRAARLRALLDSPHAFTSSYARESDWGESEWRRLFDDATCMVAREADQVIGLAKSVAEPCSLGCHTSSPSGWRRHIGAAGYSARYSSS
jgi:hypothetical protein